MHFPEHHGALCWSTTSLMTQGGDLLTINNADMVRSRNRIRTKAEDDSDDEYTGPPVTSIANLTQKQCRIVLYHQLFRFLNDIGRRGVRVVLPSCCVTLIQQSYSDPQEPASADESVFES